jgi:hypothetical protein
VAPALGSHHVKKIEDARACLNIVGPVEMGIVEFIVPVCDRAGEELKTKSTASASTRANRYAQYKKSLLVFTTSVHFVFGLLLGRALIEIVWTRMGAAAHPP